MICVTRKLIFDGFFFIYFFIFFFLIIGQIWWTKFSIFFFLIGGMFSSKGIEIFGWNVKFRSVVRIKVLLSFFLQLKNGFRKDREAITISPFYSSSKTRPDFDVDKRTRGALPSMSSPSAPPCEMWQLSTVMVCGANIIDLRPALNLIEECPPVSQIAPFVGTSLAHLGYYHTLRPIRPAGN